MAQLNIGIGASITNKNFIYPLYDWRTVDVWMYLKDNKVDIPIIYLWMYQVGVNRNQLRICQLFSIDCVGSLIYIAEYEPGLWERILKREPNAYLAMLYWDSELYRRSSKTRRSNETPKDYYALCKKLLIDEPDKHFTTDLEKRVAAQYKKLILKWGTIPRQRDYKKIYDALVAGDPKLRTFRAVNMDIASGYAEYAKKYRKEGGDEHHAGQ
jgi:predicted phosphoadenosine phosphosulfate sulfurtransferase